MFPRIVHELQALQGIPFHVAWQTARAENSDAYERFVSGAAPKSEPGGLDALRSRVLALLVNRETSAVQRGDPDFDAAWARVRNRVSDATGGLDLSETNMRRKAFEAFTARYDSDFRPNNMALGRNGVDLIRFGDNWAQSYLAAYPGQSPEHIWQAMENEDPALFESYFTALFVQDLPGWKSAYAAS